MPIAFTVTRDNWVAFSAGEFVNCTAEGVNYDSVKIKQIIAPFVIIDTSSGDKKIHQKDFIVNIRPETVVQPSPPRRADRREEQLLFHIQQPELSLRSYAGQVYAISDAPDYPITASFTKPIIIETTFHDDGTATVKVNPNNSPESPPASELEGLSGAEHGDAPPVWTPGYERRLRMEPQLGSSPREEAATLEFYRN
ncbi:hypothetical protein HCU66_12525 [Pseudomonas frederiksbergensis]|uniref:hypothetical protein n=1 Tax=Pseudomonas frederiksbergensis TaxID=104087 RepID=UPI00197FAC73|nr:hypothetical protein [Pseudomonas frederiksbergensis]MBN3863053.1 hypothetical protein [Pseudomonas frederiksbergensis]